MSKHAEEALGRYLTAAEVESDLSGDVASATVKEAAETKNWDWKSFVKD